MSRIVKQAATVSVAAMLIFTLFSAGTSGAAAQDRVPVAPAVLGDVPAPIQTQAPADDLAPQSLEALVDAQDTSAELSSELKCLAGAIYFEARSESLAGQLAVGRVIVARTRSGRFPASYCGVVYQPAQFSFVRGRSMPEINTDSAMWDNAVAVAQIADAGSWQSRAEGALFFHSARIAPHWRMHRIAQVDNHIFYR